MRAASLLLLFTVGCSSCGDRPGSGEGEEPETEPNAQPTARDDLRTLRGTVRLGDGAELPLYPEAALREGAAGDRPGECSPPRTRDRMPVRMHESRGLANLVVTVSDPEGRYEAFVERIGEWEPTQHEVVIRNCRLDPPVLAATVGDSLLMKTEHDYPFLPSMGRSGFMQALMRDEPREVELEQGGVQSIQCGFTAPCGRTDVVIAYTPVHTLSGEDGSFELTGVPRDMDVVVHAWHPLFQEATARVVAGTEDGTVELVIEPAPQPEAPAVQPGEDGTRPEDGTDLF